MIIQNITIENFQSYFETQSIEFSKGLNLVIGNGGKGKSKLFNAFYWVLFGKIYITGIGWCSTDTLPHSAKFSMRRHDFINKRALYKADKTNDSVKTSVHIEIEDDNGLTYWIERAISTKRLESMNWDDSDAWEVSNAKLKVSFDSVNGTVVRTDYMAEDKIKELFPEGIRNYIWFQGESLESLINFRDRETLKDAVKHISYFPYYEKLSEIISKSKLRIERNETAAIKAANKHNANVKGRMLTIEKLRSDIEKEESNRKVIEENISALSIALATDENKMTGLASFADLINKYKTCENEIFRLNTEISKIDADQRELLPKLWILRGINSMVVESKNIIESHKKEEDTVPELKYLDNPSRTKLEEIKRDKRCFVCGSDVIEGNSAYDWINNRLKEQETYLKELDDYAHNMQFNKQFNMFIGKIQDYPDSLLFSIPAIDKQWRESEDNLENLMALRRKKLEEKTNLDNKIEEVKRKHNVDPIKQAASAGIIGSGLKATRSNLDREHRKLDASKQTLTHYKAALKIEENELEKAGNKGGLIKVQETEWRNISTFLEDICKRVQENARKELLHKIEIRANDFYNKFTEHDNGYKGDVKIGDDYSIEFDPGLNTSHEDRKKMSIINAMLSLNQDAMRTYYPFISDAPTSSFDLETTYKYLLGIKDIFGQTIIMTKDVDLNSETYQNLVNQNNISKIYVLESQLYCNDNKDPELYEVSTLVNLPK